MYVRIRRQIVILWLLIAAVVNAERSKETILPHYINVRCAVLFASFDDASCEQGFIIHVINAHYGYYAYNRNESESLCSFQPNDCLVPVPWNSNGYYGEILDGCNGKESCDSGLEAKQFNGGAICDQFTANEYVLIEFYCLPSEVIMETVTVCASSPLDQGTINCTGNRVIQIVGAILGFQPYDESSCRPGEDRCRIRPEPFHIENIRSNCQGQRKCQFNASTTDSIQPVYHTCIALEYKFENVTYYCTSSTEDPCDFYTGATTISSGTSSVSLIIDRPCLDRPCHNGATCVENCTTFSCICTEGFTGYICDVEINECETIPCYPFGECEDFIGGYSCKCKGGYERINDTLCKETDFCANETQPCENGGTCVNQNALNRYYCICPEQFVGLRCEIVLATVARPTVNGGISPTSGIMAGGANVTISGKWMASFQPLGAYLVDTTTTASPLPSLYAFVIPDLTSNDSITVQIPPAHSGYINHSLLMIVEYSGPINVTSEAHKLIFKYTGNPVIHAIEPTDILVTGGVRLTVSGENMDSAQNPVMEITTIVVNKTAGSSEEEYKEICAQKNSSAITCLIPYGIVPESFINNTATAGKSLRGVFHLDSSLWAHKIGRRTKRAPVANLTDETGNTFEMYLGFIFDAFPTYENLSKSLPNITLNFVPLQVYFDPTCSMDFVTNKMDTISLSGKDLTYGCSKDDYTVLISNVTCAITSLTDSMLECQPPDDEPTINDPSAYCAHSSDPHPIKITVGTLTQHACCVSYTVDNTDLIIVVTVTCVVVVAIIILVAVLLYKRHKKNKVVKNANYRASVKSKDENEYDSVVGQANGNDDAVLTHDRSYVGANHGKQTNAMAMAMAPQRGHPTAVQPDHDDYMQPRDIPAAVFDNHGGMGDADIRGDSSGRTHDNYANAGLYGHRGEQHVEAYGVAIRRHKEPVIDNNLMEVDPEIDY